MPRRTRHLDSQHAFTYDNHDVGSNQDHIQAFKQRQQQDYRRYEDGNQAIARRTPFRQRYQDGAPMKGAVSHDEAMDEGEEGWQNSEGERLQDFGLDEEAEFYDEEDDIPLSQLLLRRRQDK